MLNEKLALRRWTLIGDIGGEESFHVGDEAMLESNLNLFRAIAPDTVLQVVSADPEFTRRSYGIQALPRLGFEACASDTARESLLERFSHSHWTNRAPAAFDGLLDPSDGLVISGGGNLRSTWPACIYERLALCRRAAANGAPVILLGQTLGPELSPRHREMVSEILRTAEWVGVREIPSFELALELGARPERLSYQLDDAHDLAREAHGQAPTLPFPAGEPWIGVTIHPFTDPSGNDPLLDRLALQLEQAALRTGCRLVFIPHAKAAAAAGAPWSDESIGQALAIRMRAATLHLLPVLPAAQVARLTAQAQLIVSSRYHPIVFGLAGSTPCLGIWVDAYTRTKLQGALHQYDCADDTCTMDNVLQGQLTPRLLELWMHRAERRARIEAHGRRNLEDEWQRRSALARLVTTRTTTTPPRPARLARIQAAAASAQRLPHPNGRRTVTLSPPPWTKEIE